MNKFISISITIFLFLLALSAFFADHYIRASKFSLQNELRLKLEKIYYVDGYSILELSITNESPSTVYIGDTEESRKYAERNMSTHYGEHRMLPGIHVFLDNQLVPAIHTDQMTLYQINSNDKASLFIKSKGDFTKRNITKILYAYTHAESGMLKNNKNIHCISTTPSDSYSFNDRIPKKAISE